VPGHRILVVATAELDDAALRDQLDESGLAELHVVSPASKVSPLQWLANEEDEARAEAERTAERTADSIGDEDRLQAEVGDTDPIQAAEDALREFEADEIVVIVPPEEKASWLERRSVEDGFERFGLPVRYLVAANEARRA
jgi:hypothetical protein